AGHHELKAVRETGAVALAARAHLELVMKPRRNPASWSDPWDLNSAPPSLSSTRTMPVGVLLERSHLSRWSGDQALCRAERERHFELSADGRTADLCRRSCHVARHAVLPGLVPELGHLPPRVVQPLERMDHHV